jgi:DNA-binding response OmpR family regulator
MKKILIVDDDIEFLQELSELLVSNSYNVSTCADGERALDMIPKIMPDLILLDLKINKLNGFQVAAKLKTMPKACDIPVIAITGHYTQDEYSLMMKLCGAKKFIIKPIDPGKIIDEVESVLRN